MQEGGSLRKEKLIMISLLLYGKPIHAFIKSEQSGLVRELPSIKNQVSQNREEIRE